MVIAGVLLAILATSHVVTAALGPPDIPKDGIQVRQVQRAGTNIRLLCPARGDPSPILGWEKDGEGINAGWERFRVGHSSLRIKNLAEDDSGKYVCQATNGFGSATLEYWLYVYPDTNDTSTPPFPENFGENPSEGHERNIFPVIDGNGEPPHFVNPKDMLSTHFVKPRGSTIRLKCRSSGRPKPDIRWFHNGLLLPQTVASDDDGSRSDRWTLKLSDVSDDHDGQYTCRVQNRAGAINFTYYVEVVDHLSKPMIMDPHPLNTTVKYGHSTSLQCTVKSDVQPTIQWLKRVDNPHDLRQKNTTIEVENEQFIVLKTGLDIQREDGTYLNKLTIYNAIEFDSGMYICLGANSMGYNLRSAFLTVLPNPNRGLTFDDDTSDSMQSPALALIIGLPAIIVLVVIVLTIFLVHRFCSAPKAAKAAPRARTRTPPVDAPYGLVSTSPPHDKMFDHQYMALRPQQVPNGKNYGHNGHNHNGHHHSGSDNSHKNYAHSDTSSNAHRPHPQQHSQMQPMLPHHPYLPPPPSSGAVSPPPGVAPPGGPPHPPHQHMHYHYGC